MNSSYALLTLALLCTGVISIPMPKNYIVSFRSKQDRDTTTKDFGPSIKILKKFDIIPAFLADLDDAGYKSLASDYRVKTIEEDGKVHMIP